MAMATAGFTGGEAEELRRAFGFKRSERAMKAVEEKLRAGMARQGITGETAEAIIRSITAFALYGFPECVVGETRVIDADTGGWVKLADIVSGRARVERTLACDVDLKIAKRRVLAATASGRRMVYRVRTALGREIAATAEHPLFTMEGWRALGVLRAGDHIASARLLPTLGSKRWPRHRLIVLADLIAEGNLCHPSTLYFSTTDPHHRDEFVGAVERFDNTRATVARHRDCYSVHVRRGAASRPIGVVEWAKQLGIWGIGARAKHLPGEVFELRVPDLALLLARLWEGDGSLSLAGHASYDTASRPLAEEVQHLLLRLGIVARVSERVRSYRGRRVTGFVVTATGQANLRRFSRMIARRFLSVTKRRRMKEIIQRRTASRASRDVIPVCSPDRAQRGYRRETIACLARSFDSPDLARLARSDISWDRITAIEPVGERETYDLQIESDHNFVANDLVAHNSHAASFALLAYASAYLKTHHPAAFYAALLNNQPMGFYHPATIVRDAERHGQVIHPADVNSSGWLCVIEPDGAVRLGLRYVRGLREEIGTRIEEERRRRPFASVADLVKRAGLHRDELDQLAQVGALGSLRSERRAAIWEAARAGRPAGPLYEALADPPERSPLRAMTPEESLIADYEGTGLSLGPHPMAFHRARLDRMKVARAADLARMRHGARVRVAGAVIVRQRPGTAKGFVFLNLEDETGLTNVIVRPALFRRHRLALVNEPFLFVEGTLQHQDNVVSIRAERLWPLRHRLAAIPSHDFH
jgi:DNA polymerase-3 subunit alpha